MADAVDVRTTGGSPQRAVPRIDPPKGSGYSAVNLAVHVLLSRDEVRSILSLYRLETLEDYGGIAEGTINTSYWVQVAGRRYFLRITERKRVQDMVFERELLSHLARAEMPVPRLVENVAKGTFTPWSVRGRFVSLFDYMEGRHLGLFEVRPTHVRCVGQFAARLHLCSQPFQRVRPNEFDMPALDRRLQRLEGGFKAGRLGARHAPDLELIEAEMQVQRRRTLEHLPRGTVHGDLFVDNMKFKDGNLVGVIDFELAATERYVWEIAVALNAWCWEPAAEQRGGPAGRFDRARTRAFLRAYAAVRPLTREERLALPDDLRLAAARFAITRLLDFEMKKFVCEVRGYKDYRHYLERLRTLRDGGAEALIEDALGT